MQDLVVRRLGTMVKARRVPPLTLFVAGGRSPYVGVAIAVLLFAQLSLASVG
jgi:hypothetical protein